MSIMVNTIDQILEISGQTASGWLKELLDTLFPAPLTLLIPQNRKISSAYWDQFSKIGFRLPDHLLSQKLLEVTGKPLITTSANIMGEPPALSAQDLSRDLISQVELTLDGGPTREKIASTILDVDLNSRRIKQIREGALAWSEIERRIAQIQK
jgi:tRNA threonylcarbamoyl adenosine modification protein (Sua5/YciO/YrdC/YwlC family)